MKTLCSILLWASSVLTAAWLTLSAGAQTSQLISVVGPAFGSSSGGSGDSWAPNISADGRHVLFSSMAQNLLPTSTNSPLPTGMAARLNVFLRDRASRTTTLVSVNPVGTSGNGDSLPLDVSPDGRYALFQSVASNLATGDTNAASDVFLRDMVNGTNLLVSANTNGVPGNGPSQTAAMTPDGRFVVFVSAASDLVTGDTNAIPDVFVRDLLTGTTTLVSIGATSTNLTAPAGGSDFFAPYGDSDFPAITPDGHYVVFSSTATNSTTGVQSAGDVYVRDLFANTTTWASVGARAAALMSWGHTNIYCYGHRISPDGQFVAYEACPISGVAYPPLGPYASGIILRYNLQTGLTDIINTNAAGPGAPDFGEFNNVDMSSDGRFVAFVANTNGRPGAASCVCVWEADTGTTVLASRDLTGAVQTNTVCSSPTLDASGQFLFFISNSTNLTAGPASADFHLYRRDLLAGTNQIVDVDLNGVGSVALSPVAVVTISTNGRFAAFEAPDGGLVPNDINRATDLFVRDLAKQTTELLSPHDPALHSQTANGHSGLGASCVSTNGRYIAFVSDAPNLVPNDTNGCSDVFVRDLVAGSNILVSVAADGVSSATGLSLDPAISPDGRYVAFTSIATNLAGGTITGKGDIYVRNLATGSTTLASINLNGTGSGNGASLSPWISAGGKYVLFRSTSGNLNGSGAASGSINLYLRDIAAGITYALTTNATVIATAATPDGRIIAYCTSALIYLWNSATATRTTYANTRCTALAISPDGTKLAYSVSGQIRAADLSSRSDWLVASWPTTLPTTSANRLGLRFSGDSRYLVYATAAKNVATDSNSLSDVYLYDYQTHSNLLVSKSFNSPSSGNAASDSPDISQDGRFVVFRSDASNLVPGDNNTAGDLFLYDLLTGNTSAVSVSQFRDVTANNCSFNAYFSGDSSTLVFESWASDLVSGDFNQSGDIFAINLKSTYTPTPFAGQIFFTAPPKLIFPALFGHGYLVQFKNNLSDATWQVLNGQVTVVGNQGSANDLAPEAGQRFYRIVAY